MSTILFEALGGLPLPPPPAYHLRELRFTGLGFAQSISELGAIGDGELLLEQDNAGPQPPAVGFCLGDAFLAFAPGYSFGLGVEPPATGDATLALLGWGYETDTFGDATLTFTGSGSELAPPPTDGVLTVYAESALAGGEAHSTKPTAVVDVVLSLRGGQHSLFTGTRAVVETLRFETALHTVFQMLVEEGIAFGAASTITYTAIERVVERLLLSGEVETAAEALQVVTIGLAFGQLASASLLTTAGDELALNAAVTDALSAMNRLVETLLLDAVANPVHTAVVSVREDLVLGETLASAADMATLINESLTFVTRLKLDSGEYIAWALNTEGKGLSRYTQFPFNSFAKIGGRYFGACSDGLYRLEGDDDAGVPIANKLRMGLTAFGTRRLKRLPDAFIAYTSTGTLLLRVIVVNEQGEKEAAIYKLAPRPAGVMRENRFQIGRGLKSIDWDFELESVDGADFDLHSLEFRPLLLDRRTRG